MLPTVTAMSHAGRAYVSWIQSIANRSPTIRAACGIPTRSRWARLWITRPSTWNCMGMKYLD